MLKSVLIGEVEKVASRFNRTENITPGVERLPASTIRKLPALAGEKDVLKAYTYMPGILSGTEGTTEISVRGGSSDQNLYLLDNNVLYKSSHLLGMLSSFQVLTAEETDFYKAGFPAIYGGRLSSVVNVKTLEPDFENFDLEGELGVISAKLMTQIPIVKNKSTLMLAARGTYIDQISKLLFGKDDFESVGFYDMQAKLTIQSNYKNRLVLNVFLDHDTYYKYNRTGKQKEDYIHDEQNWGNRFFSIDYERKFSNRGSTRFFAGNSFYEMEMKSIHENPDTLKNYYSRFKSDIKDFTLKNQTTIPISDCFIMDFGGEFILHAFNPASVYHKNFSSTVNIENLRAVSSKENTFYAELLYKAARKLNFRIGIRNNNYDTHDTIYHFYEPRIVISYKTGLESIAKVSFSKMSQPMHLLTNPGLHFPVDIWMSSNRSVHPGISFQSSVGYTTYVKLGYSKLGLNAEAYYRKLKNIVSYRDGYSSHNFTTSYFTTTNTTWDKAVTQGKGDAIGLELMAEKLTGDITGWISYSLASVTHCFEELNQGKPFPSNYDRRHNFSIVGNYRINPKFDFTFSWVYGSGFPVTLPLYIYAPGNFDFSNGSVNYNQTGIRLYAQSGRNQYRMLDFHRLNAAVRRNYASKHFEGYIELGVYNLYNRKNSFYYFVDDFAVYDNEAAPPNNVHVYQKLKSASVFPVIPSLGIVFKLK